MTMKYNFDKIPNRRGTNSLKWDVDRKELPMWQELFQEGEALYYGLNALSNNMIMVDRKRLKNPNGLTNFVKLIGLTKLFSENRQNTLSLHPQSTAICRIYAKGLVVQRIE